MRRQAIECIMFVLIGIAIISLGVGLLLHSSQLQGERTATANGEVISTDVIHSTSGSGKHKHKRTSYYVTVKYFDEYGTTSEKTTKI